jgi:negative regulator of sigma E activity
MTRTYLLLAFCFLSVFGVQATSKQSENSDQPKKTATNRQATAQRKVQSPPAATVSNTTFIYKPAPEENQKARDEKPIHNWNDHINSLSTAVMAAFTVLMCVVVYRQGQTTKISQRAWVFSDIPISPQQSGDQIQVICKITNSGHTPAWITSIGSSGQFVKSEEDLPRIPNYPKTKEFGQSGLALAPQGYTESGVMFEMKRFESVQRGEVILYFYGFVKYRDAFDQPHVTRYCYHLKQSQDITSQSILEFYTNGPEGYNTAD